VFLRAYSELILRQSDMAACRSPKEIGLLNLAAAEMTAVDSEAVTALEGAVQVENRAGLRVAKEVCAVEDNVNSPQTAVLAPAPLPV
jgi:hypothetical protein